MRLASGLRAVPLGVPARHRCAANGTAIAKVFGDVSDE
jgi:hypothetical protein